MYWLKRIAGSLLAIIVLFFVWVYITDPAIDIYRYFEKNRVDLERHATAFIKLHSIEDLTLMSDTNPAQIKFYNTAKGEFLAFELKKGSGKYWYISSDSRCAWYEKSDYRTKKTLDKTPTYAASTRHITPEEPKTPFKTFDAYGKKIGVSVSEINYWLMFMQKKNLLYILRYDFLDGTQYVLFALNTGGQKLTYIGTNRLLDGKRLNKNWYYHRGDY